MTDQDRLAQIRAMRDYIEQHRATMDRETIRQHVLAEGHDPETIRIALYLVYGPRLPPSEVWEVVVVCLSTVVLNIIVWVILAPPPIVPLLATMLSFVLLESVAALVLWRRNRTVARGLLCGGIMTLVGPPLFFIIICTVAWCDAAVPTTR